MKIMTITNNLIINFKQLQKYCFISRPQNIPPNRKKTRSRSRRKQMHLKQVQQLIPGRVIPIICTGTRPAAAWRVFVWHPVLCKTEHLPYASGSTRCTGCKRVIWRLLDDRTTMRFHWIVWKFDGDAQWRTVLFNQIMLFFVEKKNDVQRLPNVSTALEQFNMS